MSPIHNLMRQFLLTPGHHRNYHSTHFINLFQLQKLWRIPQTQKSNWKQYSIAFELLDASPPKTIKKPFNSRPVNYATMIENLHPNLLFFRDLCENFTLPLQNNTVGLHLYSKTIAEHWLSFENATDISCPGKSSIFVLSFNFVNSTSTNSNS